MSIFTHASQCWPRGSKVSCTPFPPNCMLREAVWIPVCALTQLQVQLPCVVTGRRSALLCFVSCWQCRSPPELGLSAEILLWNSCAHEVIWVWIFPVGLPSPLTPKESPLGHTQSGVVITGTRLPVWLSWNCQKKALIYVPESPHTASLPPPSSLFCAQTEQFQWFSPLNSAFHITRHLRTLKWKCLHLNLWLSAYKPELQPCSYPPIQTT